VTLLLFAPACIGLSSVPDKDGRDQHDLDTGWTWETGEPLDSATDMNGAPEADAGPDQDATLGLVVQLDGSGSSDPDGDALRYAWRFRDIPGPSSAELVDEDRADAQFLPDMAGVYELGLVVSDGALESEEDTVVITVVDENGAPTANAGPNQTVDVGETVYLDGSDSSDPDGDALQFAWTLATRPGGSSASLNSSTSATPRFTADVAGTYQVTLTVSDGTSTSSEDSVTITATDGGDTDTTTSCGCKSGHADPALGLLALLFLRRR
jgi:hypothetical protein